ncbi:MAG: T9SS type A sorting domain-containing protein [bacterium]
MSVRLLALLLLLAAGAAVALQMKRVMLLSPSARSNGSFDYHPTMDMDCDGFLEMAYSTGRSDSMTTNPQRWEYGRFLPFNRWQILYADTIMYPPPMGLQPAYFAPMDAGDADRDGLNELLGHCYIWKRDTLLVAYCVLSTMEQQTRSGPPDTINWFRSVRVGIDMTSYVVGSLDDDSLYDFINYSDSVDGHVVVENRGNNSYARTWTFPWRPTISSLGFGDCDMDGRTEFIGGWLEDRVFIWETVGDNQFECIWQDSVNLPNAGHDCFSGRDVNQNGRPEFFASTARYIGGVPASWRVTLNMWEALGDNRYQRTRVDSVQRQGMNPYGRSMCGDVDGDGVDEIVWSTTSSAVIMAGKHGGSIEPVSVWSNDHGSTVMDMNINIADVNRNGYNDILIAANRKLSVVEVEAVRLLHPDSGYLPPGDSCRISWRTFTPPRCDSVSLFLRLDSTYRLDTIAHGLAPADTPYVWVVPDIRAESAWVMAIAYGPGWQYDECDSPIRILGSGAVEEQPQPVLQTSLKVRPNPARGRMSIEYVLGRAGPAEVSVLDAVGRKVALLATGEHLPGRYRVAMDRVLSRAAPGPGRAGVYFVRMVTGQERIVQKVVVQ